MPLLGRDLLSSLGAILQLGGPKQSPTLTLTETDQQVEQDPISYKILYPSHILQAVDHSVWDKGIPGKAVNVKLVKITLKPEATYPNKRSYPRNLEAKTYFQPLIDKSLKHGLLVPCQSPCSTPILPVVTPNGDYGMAQTLEQ